MRARIAGAARGARWLPEGWKLFRAAPLGWLAVVFVYWLLMTLVSVIPVVGIAAASMLVPGLSVGFMAAARAVERGQPLEIGLLFDGFRHTPRELGVLGAGYFACLAAVLGATSVADGGALAGWMLSGQRPPDEVMQSDAFSGAMLTAALLYAPVMMMFWFAPPLAAWHATSPLKALFFSLAAFLMNWRAFLAYAAVTGLVVLVLPFLAVTALMLVSGGAVRGSGAALMFPLLVLLLPTLFASFYVSYRDVFAPGPTVESSPAA